jgi:hypothetical protein
MVALPQPRAMIGNAARYRKNRSFLEFAIQAANNPLFAADFIEQ